MALFRRIEKRSLSGLELAARILLSSTSMMDLIFIGATCTFFVIALSYVWGCTRL